MKGVVFSELLSMVDTSLGEDVTESVLNSCPLPSGGIYTSVDTYDASELLTLINALSEKTGATVDELQRAYGHWLFSRFHDLYPQMFVQHKDAFSLLSAVGPEIHTEVLKLFPDAELPDITAELQPNGDMVVTYQSTRNLPAFCRGLIEGCLKHYGVDGTVEGEPIPDQPVPTHRFTVKRT